MDDPPFALTLVAALGCGLVAGVFFAFSGFVMRALRRLPSAEGVRAMQSINVVAVTPPLMTALFGIAAACLALVVWGVVSTGEDWAAPVIAGAALYLVGNVVVTIACNVPLNDRLAALKSSEGPEAAALWDEYLSRWTAWNHVRTVTGLGAAAALTAAVTL